MPDDFSLGCAYAQRNLNFACRNFDGQCTSATKWSFKRENNLVWRKIYTLYRANMLVSRDIACTEETVAAKQWKWNFWEVGIQSQAANPPADSAVLNAAGALVTPSTSTAASIRPFFTALWHFLAFFSLSGPSWQGDRGAHCQSSLNPVRCNSHCGNFSTLEIVQWWTLLKTPTAK